jgi:hypothetical protein
MKIEELSKKQWRDLLLLELSKYDFYEEKLKDLFYKGADLKGNDRERYFWKVYFINQLEN